MAVRGVDGATVVVPAEPAAEADQLLSQSSRKGGLDTRELAAELGALQPRVTPEAFSRTLSTVESRLSPADLSRLSETAAARPPCRS